MANIIKPLYYLIFIVSITQNLYSQVLINTNINLNSGARINDIANIETFSSNEKFYLLAGDFTSINGQSTNGLQFISKSTLDPVTPSRFANITNASFTQGNWGNQITEINSVKYYKKTVINQFITYQVEYFFVGGTFQEVNGDIHIGFCMFKSINGTNFTLDDEDPDFGVGNDYKVNDCVINNDTLFISGYFGYTENSLYDPNGLNSITAFTLPHFDSTYYAQDNNFQNTFQGKHVKLHLVEDQIIAYTPTKRYLLNNGIHHIGFYPQGSYLYNFFGAEKYTDSTFIAPYSLSQSGYIHLANSGHDINEHKFNNASTIDTIYNPSFPVPSPKSIFYSGFLNLCRINDLNRYKNDFYFMGSQRFNSTNFIPTIWKRNLNDTIDIIIDSIAYNNNIENPKYNKSHIFDNKLFYCPFFIDSLKHQPFTGLAVYCLEPMDVNSFSVADTTVCGGQDSVLYVVAQTDYATDYKWEYSGTGFIIHQNSGTTPLDTLTPSTSHFSGDSIYVNFGANFTPGTLTVTALSECGIPSKPYSINILSNPLPHVYAGLDTTLNCKRDTVVLIGSSTTTNVTYKWNPFSFPSIIGTNDTVSINGEYIFEVRDSIGCTNYDTVSVTMDTVAPVANPITDPDFITCSILSRTFNGTTAIPSASDSIYWRLDTNYFNNPIIASQPTATYHLIALNKINGCADSSQNIILNDNRDTPEINVQGYLPSNIHPTITLETLTCSNDTLNLITESSTPNTTTNWTSADSTQLYGSQLEITEAGFYYVTATNNSNGCDIFKTLFIDIDTAKPIAVIPSGQISELSCSLDTVSLIGGSPSSNTNSYWTGPNSFTASNLAVITNPGVYYINVNSILNGCTNVDSITVAYNPTILVSIGNDTVACNQESVLINSSYIGANITSLNYSWNNGATTNSTNFIAGIDSVIIIEIFGDNTCYGTDTIILSTPPNPEVSISSFKPCGAGNDGQIVLTPTNGWTPFTYSIDNGLNFQNTGTFNNLPYGTYPLIVRDSLGCDYNFSSTINENSNLPTPLFLVQTYNFSSDTVILVDVSSPPTDSSSWTFPASIQVLDNNSLAPIIILPDTGSFDVTMSGYYGNCSVDVTKTIYALDYDSTFATASNANGIKTMQLYPNPNTGSFTIEVEFFKKQQAVITVQDINGNNYVNNQYGEVDYINEFITLSNVINGTYILKIVSEFDSRHITFIVTQ